MNKKTPFLIFLICVAQTGSFASMTAAKIPVPFHQPFTPEARLQVMAHRGAMSGAPENTKAALELSFRLGFEWVEVDVRLTSDGHHVLFHDARLDEKTNGIGFVNETPLDKVKTLDAGSWFSPRFTGERILTLQEGLELAQRRFNLYLDCKDIDPALLVKEIQGLRMEDQVAVYGDLETLRTIDALSNRAIPLMAKCRSVDHLYFLLERIQVDIIEVDAGDLTPELVREAHRPSRPHSTMFFAFNPAKVQIKTLGRHDREDMWQKAIDLGVDYAQTDYGDRVQGLLYHHATKNMKTTQVAAHRGFLALAPENTLASMERAALSHCDFVEVDARTSNDGVIFAMHDSTVDKTTDLSGRCETFPWSVLLLQDAGKWFSPYFKEERIPTLEEAIGVLKQYETGLYLDNKGTDPNALLDILRGQDYLDRTVIYGGIEDLASLKALEPSVKLMPPLGDIKQIDKIAERLQPYAVDARWEILSPELMDACHEKGIRVFSDALGGNDDLFEYQKAIRWNIDAIQSNYPTLVQRAVMAHLQRNEDNH